MAATYINNVRIILHACNNYLKVPRYQSDPILIDTFFLAQWIGIDDCRKPIKNGPSLAGLPGGLAGDLMRLYPIQTNDMYPLKVRLQDEQ